jgi:hypothetical protein
LLPNEKNSLEIASEGRKVFPAESCAWTNTTNMKTICVSPYRSTFFSLPPYQCEPRWDVLWCNVTQNPAARAPSDNFIVPSIMTRQTALPPDALAGGGGSVNSSNHRGKTKEGEEEEQAQKWTSSCTLASAGRSVAWHLENLHLNYTYIRDNFSLPQTLDAPDQFFTQLSFEIETAAGGFGRRSSAVTRGRSGAETEAGRSLEVRVSYKWAVVGGGSAQYLHPDPLQVFRSRGPFGEVQNPFNFLGGQVVFDPTDWWMQMNMSWYCDDMDPRHP